MHPREVVQFSISCIYKIHVFSENLLGVEVTQITVQRGKKIRKEELWSGFLESKKVQ